MKKIVLSVALIMATSSVLNANSSEKIKEDLNDHQYCKAQAVSIAFTLAEISGEEAKISDFKEAYSNCMGY